MITRTKEGKAIVSCCMTDYTEERGNCASCMYYKVTGPFGDGYCRDNDVKTKEENEK